VISRRFRAQGGDLAVIGPMVAVAPEFLEAARDEMRRRFGTIERYFSEGLGLDEDTQETLRGAFVESA
jgi:protein-tyrosine phosphatase